MHLAPMSHQQVNNLKNVEGYRRAALVLKTLASEHRLRMLHLLLESEYSVSDLANACRIPKCTTSEYLCLMMDRGLLTRRRVGHRVHYEISVAGLKEVIECVMTHFGEMSER